jgi:hypothetical protein
MTQNIVVMVSGCYDCAVVGCRALQPALVIAIQDYRILLQAVAHRHIASLLQHGISNIGFFRRLEADSGELVDGRSPELSVDVVVGRVNAALEKGSFIWLE